MSIILLQYTSDPRDVLDRELEHHKVHGSFTYLIIIIQVSIYVVHNSQISQDVQLAIR